MTDTALIARLIDRLLVPRIGHPPGNWPRRVYEVIQRMAEAAGTDPVQLLNRALAGESTRLGDALVDAATVGHTSFFRHAEQFAELRARLPAIASKRRRPLKVWCAACSTGEEAYSVALAAEQAGVAIEILATDVNPVAIQIARVGHYHSTRPGRVPGGPASRSWNAPPHLKERIAFAVASIVEPDALLGPFDVIFCRNVLIYFDREDVAEILATLSELLRPDGMLIISPADAVLPIPSCLARTSAAGFLKPSGEAPMSARWVLPNRPATLRPPVSVGAIPVVAPQSPSEPPLVRAARLLGAGDPSGAELVLTELLNRDPGHISGWFLLGEALLQRDERAQARAVFLRASRCDPSRAEDVDGEALRRAALSRATALGA
ncbi:MAG: methyltransferase domain-containing protein [Myxococcales bacterium]|nr:MAG: methyltransferase domain-containing protein [Myxococcales bacterium]